MGNLGILTLTVFSLYLITLTAAGETILSSVLTPRTKQTKPLLQRQARSYYDQRYGLPRPLYERLEYDVPARCGRCQEERYNDYDRPRDVDRYDDDRRLSHRPTYGNRYDRNRPYDRADPDAYDRRGTERKNVTKDPNDADDDKKRFDERDDDRRNNRNRYDDRDRYRPDYYDRFLRDPYREDPYSDSYRERERRPYERYPVYDRYDEAYGRRDPYGGYRRPAFEDRGNGYDELGYGSYNPALGRGPHDSFRPWDETYRGQSGWDEGGRGYYFAGGRPDAGAAGYGRPDYTRVDSQSGWQNVGYARDPYDYRAGVAADPYRERAGYRPPGWHSASDRRPYRDQTGVNQADNRGTYRQTARPEQNNYGQTGNRGQSTFSQTGNAATSSTTTPGNSYLYEREDEGATARPSVDTSTSPPS